MEEEHQLGGVRQDAPHHQGKAHLFTVVLVLVTNITAVSVSSQVPWLEGIAGTHSRALAELIDIMPTLADLAGTTHTHTHTS